MSCTWRTTWILKRRVALKLVRTETRESALRFVEEAQVMAQLDHPNIVPLYDVGMTAGKPYYTMRLVRGESMREVVKHLREGDESELESYSLARRMSVFVEVCQAVSYAHAKGVLHMDLKPANVMLGSHGEVQVMDWGLSHILHDGQVHTAGGGAPEGGVAGTPAYMAPEQALGESRDERVDVYALGVMLYELLTFQRPFDGDTYDVLRAKLEERPSPPRMRAPRASVPLELERLCLEALEIEPEDRLVSVAVLQAGVTVWLESKADRQRRHGLAEAKAAEGRALLEEYERLKQEVGRLEVRGKAGCRAL